MSRTEAMTQPISFLAKLSDIDTFKMPSDEELRQRYERKAAAIRPTFIDNWPKDVLALSMPTVFVPFDKGVARSLFDEDPDAWQTKANPLATELDAICGWERRFYRLNSRSPKDGCWPASIPVSMSGREIIGSIASSERCLDDCCMFEHIDDPLFICLRKFIPSMKPEGEVRCFVKDGELIAAAEYAVEGSYVSPGNHMAMRSAVDRYFAEVLKPRLHIDTVVFDLWLGREIMLIELNPYGLSDPVGAGSYDRIEAGIPGIAMRRDLTPKEAA